MALKVSYRGYELVSVVRVWSATKGAYKGWSASYKDPESGKLIMGRGHIPEAAVADAQKYVKIEVTKENDTNERNNR